MSAEIIKGGFALFCGALAFAGLLIGVDLIRMAYKDEVGDRINTALGGAMFIILAAIFGALTWAFLRP